MRHFLGALLAALLALPAAAEPFGVAEVRGFYRAADIDGLEATLAAMHRQSQTGAISYDDVRRPYVAFSVTDPAMADFIDYWIAAYPQSPYAHVVRAWYFWNEGWVIRGERIVRHTLPEVFSMMRAAHETAADEAWQSRALAPDFVPAVDAVLRLSMTAPDRVRVQDVVADAMQATPSRGILSRAAVALAPQWGGSLREMLELCALYADRVTDVADYSRDVCAADMIFSAEIRGAARTAASAC